MSYDASSIEVLEGLEPVRKRPAMYIGTTGPDGLHHLVYEIVDNSIDEALAGYCSEITVTIEEDGWVTVVDNGRGIPTDMHPTENRPACEVVMTTLHAGGKFDENSYKVSGGLHGVGVSVVNALSSELESTSSVLARFTSRLSGAARRLQNSRSPAKPTKRAPSHVSCRSRDLCRHRVFLRRPLEAPSRAVLPECRRSYPHRRCANNKSHDFCYEGGINSFVEHLNEKRSPLHPDPIFLSGQRAFDDHGREVNVDVEISLQYNDSYNESVYSFANNINTVEGGTHLIGFRTALTRTLNRYIARLRRRIRMGRQRARQRRHLSAARIFERA